METGTYQRKNLIICALSLAVITAASFFSMNAFTRPVFGNDPRWQLSFYATAVCMILCAALKRPLISLCVCAAAAIAMQIYTPLYLGLFFPVLLHAVLFDAATDSSKSGTGTFLLSLALFPATVYFRVIAGEFLSQNTPSESGTQPAGEKYLCMAGLLLLAALWVWLLIRSLHAKPGDQTPVGAKKKQGNRRQPPKKTGKQKNTGRNRLPAVYVVCLLNTAATIIQCCLVFTGEFARTLLFTAALFAGFLIYRQAIPLYNTERCKAIFFPSAPEEQEAHP